MINLYAGLSQLRAFFDFSGIEASSTNTELRRFLSKASRTIDARTHRRFYPVQQELFFDLPQNRTELRFPQWEVFEILQLADYNGTSIIPTSIVYPLCGTSYDMTPYSRLILKDSSGSSFNTAHAEKAVKLTASMGFTEDWKDPYSGWIQSESSLAASGFTAASMIVMSITGGSGDVNAVGDWPKFYADQIIRVKSGSVQEIMMVVDTTSGGSTIGVLRGQNGTAASIWGSGVAVETWYPPQSIAQATVKLASWLYESRNNPQGGRTIMPSVGQIILQDNIPEDVVDTIKNYTKLTLASEVC